MELYLLTIVLMLIIIFCLSIGIIFSNKVLNSSCGNSCPCTDDDKKSCPTHTIKSYIRTNK